MRILRWRLKLSEYDYDVVYKAGKTNVNADALSRNPVNLEEVKCNVINPNRFLNLDDPKDKEMISRMLEETDEEKEDENFELYLSDDEKDEDQLPDYDSFGENTTLRPFTHEELNHRDYKLPKRY